MAGRGGRQGRLIVAEMVGLGRGAAARPAFEPGPLTPLSRPARGAARIGDLVSVRLRGAGAQVVAVHGPASSARAALSALLASEGLGRPFPRPALEEAEEAAAAALTDDRGRRDLTDSRVITIDPEGAKDHDDAIAVAREGDAVRLWVHIADVAHFVPAGGAVDREAARRGTSVYLPGTVDPMLPPRLSTDLCSLRPGVPRKAVTVEMLIEPDGEISASRFYRSTIRSERRLTYPEVDRLFEGRGGLGDAALEADLAVGRELAERLRRRRRQRGALEIASTEPSFRFAGDRVVAVELERQTEAHGLVEECMVAANEAVARYLIARSAPTVFRYHAHPDEVRVERLLDQLEALDIPAPPVPEGPLTPVQVAGLARAAGEAVARHVERTGRGERSLPSLVLRALRQAYYAPDRVGHSGLASSAYLHFTSPIRRYPDVLAHRALLDALGLGDPGPDPAWLADAAEESSLAEREAADLERRGDRMCLAYLVEEELAEGGWDQVF
ncbi:MAG: ribonuclease, partial [Miltoncostaeaceae bacterium]|nr:ribonuclease [Miltoncostaeaceae bacterium]